MHSLKVFIFCLAAVVLGVPSYLVGSVEVLLDVKMHDDGWRKRNLHKENDEEYFEIGESA